jgi:hypothetical protein
LLILIDRFWLRDGFVLLLLLPVGVFLILVAVEGLVFGVVVFGTVVLLLLLVVGSLRLFSWLLVIPVV